ncbi:protein of unknown function [Taphrina deformans PYCC 5710]|uniref:Probable endonuclease LCL3 n=1 Tax=Taphrina deformans (strain PYCC 5710 / ATCC 11124 / CBS 356.35 / IMI 108563 / JCM 9778 / NBRC 8474) TaxID=1097556 RepID=R4XF97_TAPDE|nr:protein of unknown function [Taphrina deformans PYCC 5710]|eukprot:CCG84338.1 protein of unknown function [Taphrina deformans PYCC 5710]
MSSYSKSREVEGEDESKQISIETYNPRTWLKLPIILPVAALTAGCLLSYHLYARNLRRYATIDHLPAAIYNRKSQRGLLGHVTSVGDGDNFRFFHTPGGRLAGWGWIRPIPTDKKALRNQTIHVRIAGVDAPELAHFGKPAQPYGQEALDWLRSYLIGRRVRILIHSRDRFDRVVANPKIRTWPYKWRSRDVGVEQVKSGLATVFRQGGAEYGGLKQVMESAEAAAKKRKLGMWARGKSLETPAEYKRRTRGDDYQDTATTTRPISKTSNQSGTSKMNRVMSWTRWAIGR